MLDAETKRRIDNARDILVGKVPDPKTQVEQITFAMIYKFMDDMDQQSVGIGGEPSFFTNGYEQFAWSKLLDKRIGGEARLDLYVRALDKMSQNPHIPQLFRDIFKGAFLPYRDSETLNLFLKEMNSFSYAHSEDLGDAYEYLLSIFASQGKAGQFRTPRHIIDFIVDCVNPSKDDTVLDPACGTAGFLISAYKHILEAHSQDPLNPDEKQRLTENFVGYDISPDMVRLSRVNMYLHQFPNPTIHEYDTLTTEDRWDDNFDVILANPPFMTPKGGIRPHNRFAVRANRSEVLFVDYIAEHLNPGGRAGVVVPEGIIFQSSNAYKALRRMLVEENYLYAVVSLPAGVFNPYSGVKTSILLLDKTLARQSENILFVRITSDGFDLGAQRREVKVNDVPIALGLIKTFQTDPFMPLPESKLAQLVSKINICESKDYNLSAERYKSNGDEKYYWPMVRLGNEEFFRIESGGTPSSSKREYWDGEIPWVTLVDLPQKDIVTFINSTQRKISEAGYKHSSAKIIPKNSVLISSRATIGRIAVNLIELATNQGFKNIIILDKTKVDTRYLAYVLTGLVDRMNELGSGGTYKEISKSTLSTLEIPLPSLDKQHAIVGEIEGYQKVIDGARQVVENFKPTVPINPSWPIVRLQEISQVNLKAVDPHKVFSDTKFIYVDISSVENGTGIIHFDTLITGNQAPDRARRVAKNGDVLLSTVRPNLKAIAFLSDMPENVVFSTGFAVISPKDRFVGKFLYYLLLGDYLQEQMIARMGKGSYPSINQEDVNNLLIPLPPIDLQNEIVKDIEQTQKLVDANRQLIQRMEQKIDDRIQRVWETK